jgi:hypothetical protein
MYPNAYCPMDLQHVWDWFTEYFWRHYSSNGFAAIPISFTEIGEWSRLCEIPIAPFEVKLLRDICLTFRASAEKKRPKPRPAKGQHVMNEIQSNNATGIKALLGDFNSNFKAMKAAEAKQLEHKPHG